MSNEQIDIFNNLYGNGSALRRQMLANQKRICPKCGTPLKYMAMGDFECPSCGHMEQDDYGKVRSYLDEHGPTPAAIIEDDTGVPRIIIEDFLRKGRLEINENSPVFLKCELCGKDIKYGRICPACAKNKVSRMRGYLVDEVGEEAVVEEKKKSGGKMYTRR